MLNDRMIGESGLSRDPEEVALSGDDKKSVEGVRLLGTAQDSDSIEHNLFFIDNEHLEKEVTIFFARLQQLKKDFDFNSQKLSDAEQDLTRKLSSHSHLSASDQRKELGIFLQSLMKRVQTEIASFFSFLRVLVPAEKKDNLENLLQLVESDFDVTSEDFLKNMIDVVNEVLVIIDKTPKQE